MKKTDEQLIPRNKVAALFGISIRTVKRWEQSKGITPYHVSSRLVCYKLHEIEKIITDARANH